MFAHLDSVIQHQADRSSYQAVILGLSADDLRQFHTSLGLSQPTRDVVNALEAGYLMMLGQRLIHTVLPEAAWRAQERELYRWISQHFLKL